MMYCSYCGKSLVDDAAFCYACGKRVAIPDWDAELADPSGTAGSQGGDGRAFTTLQDFLRRLLQGLPEPDRKILEMRFWLDEACLSPGSKRIRLLQKERSRRF